MQQQQRRPGRKQQRRRGRRTGSASWRSSAPEQRRPEGPPEPHSHYLRIIRPAGLTQCLARGAERRRSGQPEMEKNAVARLGEAAPAAPGLSAEPDANPSFAVREGGAPSPAAATCSDEAKLEATSLARCEETETERGAEYMRRTTDRKLSRRRTEAQGAIPQSAGPGQALADLLARHCARSRLVLECRSTTFRAGVQLPAARIGGGVQVEPACSNLRPRRR